MYMYWVFDKNLSKTSCLSNFTTLSMVSRYIFNQSDHKFFNSQSLNCANMLPMWHLHFYTLHFHTPRISSGIQRGLQQQVTRTSKNIFITLHTLVQVQVQVSFLTYLPRKPTTTILNIAFLFYDQPEKVQIPVFSQWIALQNKYEGIP